MADKNNTYISKFENGATVDEILSRAAPGGAIDKYIAMKPNPKLNDNWYFGNPVNQRGGEFMIPPNAPYYTQDGSQSFVNDEYRMVVAFDPSWASFTYNEVTYIVRLSNCVRGYAGTGYTIDRWKINGGTLTVNEGFIRYAWSAIGQTMTQNFESVVSKNGEICTISILAKGSGRIRLRSWTLDGAASTRIDLTDEYKVYTATGTIHDGFWLAAENDSSEEGYIDIVAAPLELGDHQTAFHQDENGNWVLNEIPDYGEQLAKCQRYQNEYTHCPVLICYMDGYTTGFNFPVEMVKTPTLTTCILDKVGYGVDVNATAYSIDKKGVNVFSVPGAVSGGLYAVRKVFTDANL